MHRCSAKKKSIWSWSFTGSAELRDYFGLPAGETFYRVVEPAGTPPAIAQKLAAEVSSILRMPDILAKFKTLGVLPGGGTPEEFLQQLKMDAAIYAKIAKAGNIRVTQ